ncbi:small subunit ribosomal protein S1 [Granulicella aggregans]|uniref:Small ribosomal subunit protein bS1 n=1 Tax=Granulicella aggregans TaxID=474949 RepID=A0A7W7ZEB6_9BACT|nr:30S ribosomal protein S1 [Granulicella aggregans]MBB5058345.1 small subunit ribosomal protein S1 [Granulicella aggregans]
MVDDHNSDYNEGKPLSTEIELLSPETTVEHTDLSLESTPNPAQHAEATETHGTVATLAAGEESATSEEPDYDAADFAAALANFDREQAAETAAAANLTTEEVIVTGTVVKITDKHVVVDIGLKSEGLIPLEQVLDAAGVSKFQAGDTVEVVVEREEPEGGYLVSYDKAQRLKVWDKLEQAANDKVPVKGMVLSRVKGGLTVDIGIKAFLPGSQVEVRPVRNLDGYIGTEIEVRVIKLNKKRGNVVISRKELLEEDQNAKKSVTLSTLEEGSILTGTVKNLTDYGAFVDMGGLDGLLHITDMSWGRLTHPRDLVNVGDEIQVKVLKFDKDKQRVSLGFKQLTPDPWLDATERYPIGAQVRGRILSVTDYGAFVELEQGIEGLVHVSEMTWSKRMKHPSKMVKPGDEVDTIILSVNPNDRRISLGMKQLQDNPWEALEDKYPTGAIIEGRVRNLTDFGAFIEIEDGIDGLVHVSNLSWTKRIKHPSEVLKKGEKVRAIVLGVEPENRRLSLGVKQLQPDVWDTFFAQHRVGDVIKGKILRTAQFGAFVEIAEGVEGLCHVSEAADATGKPVALDVDSEHEFKIVKMNQEEKKVGLSIRAVGEEASRAEVESYKEREKSPKGSGNSGSSSSSSSSSSSTTLGDLINWKKSERE